jgi:hypothetical protein
MASFDNNFENFNLDDLSYNDKNGFDFLQLNESNVKLNEEHVEVDEK